MASNQTPDLTGAMLQLEDSITDSPRYRGQMRQFEEYASSLESSIQGLSKSSKALHQASLDYSTRWSSIISQVSHMAQLSPIKDAKLAQQLSSLGDMLTEIERGRTLHSEQLQQILVQPLEDELGDQGLVSQIKSGRRRVDALQSEYESQLNRLMGRKPAEPAIEQIERSVEEAKSTYVRQTQSLSLDLNRLASVRRADFLESFLSLVYAQYAFYHQSFASLRDAEPMMRALGAHVAESRRQAREEISRAEELVVAPKKKKSKRKGAAGSIDDDRGYMKVGQFEEDEDDDDYDYDDENEDHIEAEVKSKASQSTNADSQSKRRTHTRSLASISLSHNGQFQMSGYLFLRSQYSLMASWQRRWFEISDGHLVHFQRDDERDREAVPLHLCMVKQGPATGSQDRRNVFELIAPNRTYLLQAEGSQELNAWKACLKQAIEASLYSHTPGMASATAITQPAMIAAARSSSQPLARTSGSPLHSGSLVNAAQSAVPARMSSGGITSPLSVDSLAIGSDRQTQAMRMMLMRQPEGNDRCVDCGLANPEWAAINLGILMCIECSGIHRSLGVHVSKVRSVKLDNWEPELMQIMQRLGNHHVNQIFEHREPLSDEPQKPTEKSSRDARQPYIMLKYSSRLFIDSLARGTEQASGKLIVAARTADLPLALEALAQGADPNAHDPTTGSTPLIEAVGMGDFGMLELLLLWGADPNVRAKITATAYLTESPKANPADQQPSSSKDMAGGTALHWATRLGNVRVVWYLVRKGAHWDTPDAYGLLPLDIALEDSNVSVVMALRYAAFQKASGLQPGSVSNASGANRLRMSPSSTQLGGNAAIEPVDMLDMNDSFIRDWAVPPYVPPIISSDTSTTTITTDAAAAVAASNADDLGILPDRSVASPVESADLDRPNAELADSDSLPKESQEEDTTATVE
ncbi:hypothetical protein LPJ53_002891 [Coemansia erecta]|uniref:ArfGap-domain-containing protein n=1 Tax=Coemansia erecta TaxID=147472 RepID=A0A9W7Y1X3_9FUNG|nr:hypothetical protein LPJ53_002891 [Coemansia erecta]